MTGTIADIFGIKYLFLTPEYLGKVNFWSYLLLGFAFGAFFMVWNLTTYMLDSFHFPFLASLERPFTKFCLNNMIIPLIFMSIYMSYTVWFQSYNEYWTDMTIFMHCLGFVLGFTIMILLASIYFYFTNKDILNLKTRLRKPPNLEKGVAPGRRVPDIESIKVNENQWRVDTYLNESLRPRIVRSVAHYESKILLSVFRQNHVNALVVQLFGLVILITLGYLIDYPVFRIPAGASIFILASVVVAITGAITYWFHQWKITVFIVLMVFINFLTKYEMFNHKNKAYGLDYNSKLSEYTYSSLEEISNRSTIEKDKKATLKILDNWRKQFNYKPKMVVFCVSGGGLKAALWSMQVLQQSDKAMHGDLLKHTALVTGASGGLMGVAYMRELYLQKQLGHKINIYDSKYLSMIAKDLLNSLCFTIVSNDLFLPWVSFKVGEHTYKKDRGYVFEKQLNENTDYAFDKVLADYQLPEQEAIIPMMFVTPSIVNDGRRLIISPQKVSYMTIAPIGAERQGSVEIDAVDFGRLFEEQGADQLQFVTALRMNATYPYVLPNVYLPSTPEIEVMDAGFRDNYGIVSATRYIQVFQDWIKKNTSGVVLVQVSGWDKVKDEITPEGSAGVLETLFNPLGIAGQILELQDYEHDNNLGFLYDILGKENFDVIRFIYRPSSEDQRASMTFHLTNREANDIMNAFYLEENQKKLIELKNKIKKR